MYPTPSNPLQFGSPEYRSVCSHHLHSWSVLQFSIFVSSGWSYPDPPLSSSLDVRLCKMKKTRYTTKVAQVNPMASQALTPAHPNSESTLGKPYGVKLRVTRCLTAPSKMEFPRTWKTTEIRNSDIRNVRFGYRYTFRVFLKYTFLKRTLVGPKIRSTHQISSQQSKWYHDWCRDRTSLITTPSFWLSHNSISWRFFQTNVRKN